MEPKKVNYVILSVILLCLCLPTQAKQHLSPYKDQVHNQIKALSPFDLKGLERGSGTPFGGMAKAAELNGFPGPKHVLDLKKELGLSKDKVKKIRSIFNRMSTKSKKLGKKLIEVETVIDKKLKAQTMSSEQLQTLVHESAKIYGKLRYSHLFAHIETAAILSEKEIEAYNQFRGYASSDPCAHIPKGHPADMWKKHHGCRE